MQEGLAVLKVEANIENAKFLNDKIMGKNNNILYSTKREFAPENSTASLPNKSHDSTTRKHKNPYEDKAIRTTKNFIGKPCYNVGRFFFLEIPSSLLFLPIFFFSKRKDSRTHRDLTHKPMFTARRERVRLQSTRRSPRLQQTETRMSSNGKALRGSRISGQ